MLSAWIKLDIFQTSRAHRNHLGLKNISDWKNDSRCSLTESQVDTEQEITYVSIKRKNREKVSEVRGRSLR